MKKTTTLVMAASLMVALGTSASAETVAELNAQGAKSTAALTKANKQVAELKASEAKWAKQASEQKISLPTASKAEKEKMSLAKMQNKKMDKQRKSLHKKH